MENFASETFIGLEKKMWQAFSCGDSQAFSALVLPEALMVVGGSRMTGQFYGQAIAGIQLNSYHLEDFQVLRLSEDSVLVNYLASVDGGADEDLSGVFRVSSAWVRRGAEWKMLFNQDSAAARR